MRFVLFPAVALLAAPLAVHAADINRLDTVTQDSFNRLSRDLGAALSYKAVTPAEPLGVTGFDIGIEASSTHLKSPDAWRDATGSSESNLVVPKVHLHKGLPFGFDVGAFYSSVPGTNVSLWGADLSYALLPGGVAQPALALRGTYTRLQGVNQLGFSTRGLELTVSKGFAMFTPYAGAGVVRVNADPRVANLSTQRFDDAKYYLGANLNLGLVNFALEGDRTGGINSYSAKIGLRF